MQVKVSSGAAMPGIHALNNRECLCSLRAEVPVLVPSHVYRILPRWAVSVMGRVGSGCHRPCCLSVPRSARLGTASPALSPVCGPLQAAWTRKPKHFPAALPWQDVSPPALLEWMGNRGGSFVLCSPPGLVPSWGRFVSSRIGSSCSFSGVHVGFTRHWLHEDIQVSD